MSVTPVEAERLFSGVIGEQYELLKIICPEILDVNRRVGEYIAAYPAPTSSRPLKVLEIGCGTGITSLTLLTARDDLQIAAIDNEPAMLEQAKQNLHDYIAQGRLRLMGLDALTGLRAIPANSVDLVISVYALHNFLLSYREAVLEEILRVLKPGGSFINGDRYALDDTLAHTRLIQEEIAAYFTRIAPTGQYDVLQHWLIHLFSDESPDHVMRTGTQLEQLQTLGFEAVTLDRLQAVNALLTARKPSS